MEVRASFPEDSGPRNFSWVVPDELAAMGCPASLGELKTLAARGICHLVTLSEEALPPGLVIKDSHNAKEGSSISSSEFNDRRKTGTPDRTSGRRKSSSGDTRSSTDTNELFDIMLRHAGPLNWLFLPVEEYCAPSLGQVARFIEFCVNCRQRGESVAVHCRGGRGRTGVMAACYLIYFQQMSPERAITTLRLGRPGSIETYRQERIVFEFRDLIRQDSYDRHVLDLLREPHEDISLLQRELRRNEEKKLRMSYFEREQIKKEMKVLEYNTVHCFLALLRKCVPGSPDLTPLSYIPTVRNCKLSGFDTSLLHSHCTEL